MLQPRHHEQPTSNCQSLRPVAASVPPPAADQDSALRASSKRPSHGLLVLAGLASLVGLTAFHASPTQDSAPRDRAEVRINGAPAHKETDSGRPVAWLRDSVKVTLDPTLDQVGPGSDAVRAAFGAWLTTEAQLPSLSFDNAATPGTAARDGVNRVLVASIDVPGHQKDLSLTISYVDDATGELLEVDIILNSHYKWGVLSGEGQGATLSGKSGAKCGPGTYDLQDIAAHEVGHFFGLGEDKDDPNATMYFESGSCETSKRDLESSDAEALVTQYEMAAAARDQQGGCSVSNGSHGAEGGLGITLIGIALARLRRRTPRRAGSSRNV